MIKIAHNKTCTGQAEGTPLMRFELLIPYTPNGKGKRQDMDKN